MKEIRSEVYSVLKRLNEYGYEAYLVGGAVRSILLGQPIVDYDITTNALPESVSMIFRDYPQYKAGRQHGTIAVLIADLKIEITTFRKDSDYHDARHPESVSFVTDLEEDVTRRDFTINALTLDRNDTLIDLVDGYKDLEHKLIRAIGDPDRRFKEDALRILRAIRFAVRLGFTIENRTMSAMFENKELLKKISSERKRDEFLQIISYDGRYKTLKEYREIFETFIELREPNERVDEINDVYEILAFIVKENVHSLKLSKHDEVLIEEMIRIRDLDIKNEETLILSLSNPHQKELSHFLSVVHGKEAERKIKELEPYIVCPNTLDISSQELMDKGYTGKNISVKKNELCELIRKRILTNCAEDIRKVL